MSKGEYVVFLTGPDNIHKLKVVQPEHNVILVTCDGIPDFKGPKREYIARLYETSHPEKMLREEPNKKCDFQFKDLSYSTRYNVKVCLILFFVTRLFQLYSSYFFRCYNS